ncbi:sigma 54-interacting transcriptional regulator [bacterium]|nr:sigma 54-interacting transcriptional regulator [bacterium]
MNEAIELIKPSLETGKSRLTIQEEISHDLGQFIFKHIPIGIFRSTPDASGSFLLANPALVKMFEYPDMEEFMKIPVCETYWDPRDRQTLIKDLFVAGQINRRVFKFRKKDGQYFWGAVTIKLTTDDSGKVVFFDGAIEDNTESKENELRLHEERNFSESIIEALPGMFWLNDEDGKCIRWNKNVEAVYGYTPDEIRRLDAIKDITTLESLPALVAATKNALKGGSGYCEYESKTKFGKKIAFAGDSRLVTINGKKYLACVELDITKRKETEEKLRAALNEIKQLKDITDAENVYLMDEINSESSSDFIVGRSSKLNQMLHIAKKVAPTPTTVLIQGETGTGKGLLANYIHGKSPRNNRPLIKLNCANLPATLIESILFGHEKGAFTNADSLKIGRFELANNSTIFLDEIAELPLELQSKLLRVIEEGEFERLGGTKTISVDVRIIAATNRNLEEEVKAGNFRQDLLFRLNVYPITTPRLQERKSDIPLLTQFFINKFNKSIGKSVTEIPNQVMEQFNSYSWPGNIRELQNVIERAIINSTGKTLKLSNFSVIPEMTNTTTNTRCKSLQQVEYEHIINMLEQADWIIEGEKGAAKSLGLNPSTLRGRMRKLGIQRPGRITRF